MTTPRNSTSVDVDVLVVDGDLDIRSTWSEILQNAGYSVAIAADGDVALRVLGERDAGLVHLDLRMPRVDGLCVLEALGTNQLVVLASAYSLDEAIRARTGARVVTFLEKPIEPGRLLDVVATALGPRAGTLSWCREGGQNPVVNTTEGVVGVRATRV